MSKGSLAYRELNKERKMKKMAFFLLIACIVSSFFIFEGCKGKLPEFKKEDAFALLQKINAAPTGFKIEADASAVQIKTDPESSQKAPRYYISLINPVITFDTSILKEMNFPLHEESFSFTSEKIVLQYGPKDHYLALISLSGFHFELESFETLRPLKNFKHKEEKPGKTFPDFSLKCHTGDISLDTLNLSPVLEENISLLELITKIIPLNPSLKKTGNDIQMDLFVQEEKSNINQINISIANFHSVQEINPEVIKQLFNKSEDSLEIIHDLLKMPQNIFDVSFGVHGVSFSIKEKGKEKMKITLENVELSEYLKPSSEGGFYKFGCVYDLQSSNFTFPENKALESLGKIKKCKSEFNLDLLSPSFLQAYIELVKKASITKAPHIKKEIEEMGSYGMRLMNEFFSSKPIISFSFSPLEHHYGKIEAEGKFQMQQQGIPPSGKATATLYYLAGLEENIKKENLFPVEMIQQVMDVIKRYFIQDERGNGKIIFEIREKAPYLYLNNKPLKRS